MDLDELIELADPDELIREIDRRCEQCDWSGLESLAERCRIAVDRGKQLWGVAAHAEYRIALEAPGNFAGRAVDAKPTPFTLGPLTEVVASTHTWDELAEHLREGPSKGVTAYECVMRGADLSADISVTPYVDAFELPLALQRWEPKYPEASYQAKRARFPKPCVSKLESIRVWSQTFRRIDERDAIEALSQLVEAWIADSNGTVIARAVEGDVAEVASALDVGAREIHKIAHADALALMAWAGASGGVHGRRRGMSVGRARTWWALAALGNSLDHWPMPAEEVGGIAEGLDWWTWGNGDEESLELALAIVDPIDGIAFGIHATDSESQHPSPR